MIPRTIEQLTNSCNGKFAFEKPTDSPWTDISICFGGNEIPSGLIFGRYMLSVERDKETEIYELTRALKNSNKPDVILYKRITPLLNYIPKACPNNITFAANGVETDDLNIVASVFNTVQALRKQLETLVPDYFDKKNTNLS